MTKIHFKIILYYLIAFLFLMIVFTCSEKSTEPGDDNTVTISPDGGEYAFPDGMILRVPAGAVDNEMDVTLNKIERSQLQPIFDQRGVSIDEFLTCIECQPDGAVFNHPLQLILSVDLEPGTIPIVHEVDIDSGSYALLETEIVCDPEQDTLVISLNHFSTTETENVKEYEELYGECGITHCRCLRVRIEQHDKDYLCDNGLCQITESDVTVTYLDCKDEPKEESKMREVGENCKPEIHLTPKSTTVSTGGSVVISANVELGCEPIAGQSVDFSVSNPALGSVNPTYSETDEDGDAHTTFTAGENEGIVTVTARSTVSYYSFTIFASAGGVQETGHGELITEEVSETMQIQIKEPSNSWSGTIIYDFSLDGSIGEHAYYEIEYQFNVSEPVDSVWRLIDGSASGTQDVTLTINDACYDYQNPNIPATLDFIVEGAVLSDTNLYLLDLDKYDYSAFYTYEECYICDSPVTCDEFTAALISISLGTIYRDMEILPLKEGTYTFSYYEGPQSYLYYSITLNRDE